MARLPRHLERRSRGPHAREQPVKPGIHPAYGPVVFRDESADFMFCTGERCSALAGTGPGLPASLRSAVGASHHGVLVSTPCLRACDSALVVALGRGPGARRPGARSDGTGIQICVTSWRGPVRADELAASGRWVFAVGAGDLPDPLSDVLFEPSSP